MVGERLRLVPQRMANDPGCGSRASDPQGTSEEGRQARLTRPSKIHFHLIWRISTSSYIGKRCATSRSLSLVSMAKQHTKVWIGIGKLFDPTQVHISSTFVQDQFRRAALAVGHEGDLTLAVPNKIVANALRQQSGLAAIA